MSDAIIISLPRRIVARAPGGTDKNYYVFEWVDGQGFAKKISKGFPHSTSAYACLGRITSGECQ